MKIKFLASILLPTMLFFALPSCINNHDPDIEPSENQESLIYNVETFAGSTTSGDQDATGTDARFTNIRHLTICSCSGVLFAYDNGKVKRISPQGKVETITETIPDANPFFNEVGGITITHDGLIYVAGWKNIYKITPSGETSTFAPLVGNDKPFVTLGDITSDPSGALYSVENTGLIRKLTPKAQISDFYNSGKLWNSAAFGPKGYLYVVDNQGHIYKISSSGEQTLLYPKSGSTTLLLSDIAVASDGTMYVSELDNIHKITSNGDVSIYKMKDEQGKPFFGSDLVLADNGKILYITQGLKIGKILLAKK